MKKKFMIGTILTGILLATAPVKAMGNATVTFTGNNNIKVGETFTVTMNVTDIENTYDGVVSMGGNLSFDNTKLEYVSSKEVNAPYQFQINEGYNYRIAGLDMTLENGIYNTTAVYEFTFKALEEGNTTVTFENAKLTDSQDYINTSVISKEIIIEKEILPVTQKTVEVTPVVIETPEVETVVTPVVKEVIETPTIKEDIVIEETKVETTKLEETIEVKEETKIEVIEIKESFIVKAQKLFSGFISKFKKLFR